MIKVYYATTDFLQTEDSFLFYYKKVDSQRQKKIDSLKNIEDKIRSLAAGILLSYGLSQEGILQYQIAYQDRGKPYLQNQSLQFNLSHSGRYVVCGISDMDIGVDIQVVKENMDQKKIAKRFLDKKETEELNSYDGDVQKEAFTSFWAMKESYAKCTGKGLAQSLDEISLSLAKIEFCNLYNKKFQIVQSQKDNYKIAVCTTRQEEIEWREILMRNLGKLER